MTTENLTYLEFNQWDFFQIKQQIWVFFVCKMKPKDLKEIARKDINRHESLDEIQRDLRKWRIEEIHEFIYWKEYATFPNSFIISVSDDAIYEAWVLKIPLRDDEAYILDWQHRLAWFKEEEEEFKIIVSVYIWLSKFYQAMIFANINWEQVKVNKSLVRSLYWFSEERTPEMITYSIIKLLNEQETSPWKWVIKMLWKWDWILSLSTFFDELIKDIWWNTKNWKYIFDWIFSNYYKDNWKKFVFNNDDSVIYYILEDYYNSVSSEFTEEWDNKDFILNKTTWFYAFYWLLEDIIKKASSDWVELETLNQEYFDWFIKWGKEKIKPLTNDNYKAWWVGQKALYNDLKQALNI